MLTHFTTFLQHLLETHVEICSRRCATKSCASLKTQHAAQVAEGPFPWPVQGQSKVVGNNKELPISSSSCSKTSRPVTWRAHIMSVMADPHITSLMDEIDQHEKITLWLPVKPTTAGSVLEHCCQVMDTLFETHDPCIFKVGYTRHPIIRWECRKYGYMWERGWQHMVVLFTLTEPWSAAMLEAALIQHFWGHSEAIA